MKTIWAKAVVIMWLVTGLLAASAIPSSAAAALGEDEMGVLRGGCGNRCIDMAPSCNRSSCATPAGGCDSSNHPCAETIDKPAEGEVCKGCHGSGTPDCQWGDFVNCGAFGPCKCEGTFGNTECVWEFRDVACLPFGCDPL